MAQSSLRVLVIGAGLGGLCLAQRLRKAGVEVTDYERDAGLAIRTQGHRVHIDSRGELALRECLPSSVYKLFLATRGQPSKGITLFSVADGVGSRIRKQFAPHAQVLDTSMRWLGGKALLTDEIIPLMPEPMHETFAMAFGPHPAMEAAAQYWPGLRFQHTEDHLMWGLLGCGEQFPIRDENLQAVDSVALQLTALEPTKDWYPIWKSWDLLLWSSQ